MLRLTPEQFTNLQARSSESRPKQRETEEAKKRRNKFGAEATTIQASALTPRPRPERYMVLRTRNAAGRSRICKSRSGSTCCRTAQGKESAPWITSLTSVYIRDGSRVVEDVKWSDQDPGVRHQAQVDVVHPWDSRD